MAVDFDCFKDDAPAASGVGDVDLEAVFEIVSVAAFRVARSKALARDSVALVVGSGGVRGGSAGWGGARQVGLPGVWVEPLSRIIEIPQTCS